jgi:histidinol-phosphatase (PHP family)
MTGFQNLHTHTTYVDGTLSAEEMIKAALKRGCSSLGFSEHSYVPADIRYSMDPDASLEYVREINELKRKYEGTIEIFLGIEHDYYTAVPVEGLDYCIGAAHYVKLGAADGDCSGDERVSYGGGGWGIKFITVDAGADHQKQMVDEFFGGDFYAMAEAYFETIVGINKIRNVDIIAHFDLIAKYNFDGRLFDETHPRYKDAAIRAMEEILKDCRIFEVNTGMMYRFNKKEPYPSIFLLKELQRRGGEVILSSDSHDARSICYNFVEMQELLGSCGFKYIKRLTKSGFVNVLL